MFIGNLFSTSWKIKTKSEPLISICSTRMLIKSFWSIWRHRRCSRLVYLYLRYISKVSPQPYEEGRWGQKGRESQRRRRRSPPSLQLDKRSRRSGSGKRATLWIHTEITMKIKRSEKEPEHPSLSSCNILLWPFKLRGKYKSEKCRKKKRSYIGRTIYSSPKFNLNRFFSLH